MSPSGLTRGWERAVFPVAVFSRSSRHVTDTASFVLSTEDGWLLDLSPWAVEWRSPAFSERPRSGSRACPVRRPTSSRQAAPSRDWGQTGDRVGHVSLTSLQFKPRVSFLYPTHWQELAAHHPRKGDPDPTPLSSLRIQWGNPCRFKSCLSHLLAEKGLAANRCKSFVFGKRAVPVLSQHGRYACFPSWLRPSSFFGSGGTCRFSIVGLSCRAMLIYRWVVL